MRDWVIIVLEAVGYAGKEKRGQDGGVLPVEQADDLSVNVRVERPRNDDIARLEVRMADAEMAEGGVPRDE